MSGADGKGKTGKNFFIWNRRNPLKSPDSAKGIQGNPSFFVWIPLDFLGFTWWPKGVVVITNNIRDFGVDIL
jgi:hypothetical protein